MGKEVPPSEKHLQAAHGFFSKARSAQANGDVDSSRDLITQGLFNFGIAKACADKARWMSNKGPESNWKSLTSEFLSEADGILHESEAQHVLDQGRDAASMISVF